jgi:hypothetical protein
MMGSAVTVSANKGAREHLAVVATVVGFWGHCGDAGVHCGAPAAALRARVRAWRAQSAQRRIERGGAGGSKRTRVAEQATQALAETSKLTMAHCDMAAMCPIAKTKTATISKRATMPMTMQAREARASERVPRCGELKEHGA